MKRILVAATVNALVASLPAPAAPADADLLAGFEPTGELRKCVPSYQIRETRVLDETSILFRLGVRDYYVNRLPRTCPGLKLQGRFAYKLRGSSDVCNGQIITVLDGVGTGAGCILGKFEKLRKQETKPPSP